MTAATDDFNHFPEIIAEIRKVGSQLVRKAAFDVQAKAMSFAPVATGFLRSSIYIVMTGQSTYGHGVVGHGVLLPVVPAPPNDQIAYVAVGAEYGIFAEFGTRKMAARPYLTPAADAVRPQFVAAWSKLEDYLKRVH